MKNDIFRSLDFWKSSLMTMPDNSFFELLRSVFGKIRTPFNKQQLLNDLETFLLRDDIQKTIASYIDETDAKVIAAVSLFGEPFPEQLCNFFSEDFGCARLQDIIVNLEERFILYRFKDDSHLAQMTQSAVSESRAKYLQRSFQYLTGGRIALNPVLKDIIFPYVSNVCTLFPEAEIKEESRPKQAYINDLILASVFSFIIKWDSFYRSEGVIRKKIIEEGKAIFPGLDLKSALGALQVLGLFYVNENRFVPDKKRIDGFCMLSPQERMEYLSAAMVVYGELSSVSEILPPLFRGRIRDIVNIIHSLSRLLKKDVFYPENTIIKMAEILKAQTGLSIINESLIDALEKTNIIFKTSCLFSLSPFDSRKKNESDPVISIDSGFSIHVYPEINFCDAVKLASVLNVCETGSMPGSSVVRFELDKESAVRAFSAGISSDEIIELLDNLACRRLSGEKNDTLVWNLKDWEKRYKDVSLQKGVILRLSDDSNYLAETCPLSQLITETLSPGLYLLNEDAMDDAVSALKNAGIDIIACSKNKTEKDFLPAANRRDRNETAFSAVNYFPPPLSHTIIQNEINSEPSACSDQIFSEDRINYFHSLLEKMSVCEAEKSELSARIKRRIILCESQLMDADIRYEKLEARHMDYAGKQNIAKHAISQKSPVEIVLSEKGKEKLIFGIPQTIEKEGNEQILVVNTTQLSANTDDRAMTERVPLAKIVLLRRIKKSIFET